MQSGLAKTQQWVLEYETISPRKAEPLMGWTSSEDTLNQVRLKFDTQEEAVSFAEGKGWDYSLCKAKEKKMRPRNYGQNFTYNPPVTD